MSEQTMVEAVGGVIHAGRQEDRDPYDVARDVLTVVSRMTRQSCTPSAEAYSAGGDTLIYAIADWIAPVTEQKQPRKREPMTSQDLDELGRLAEDMTFLGGYEQDLGRGVIDLIADYRKAQECITRARLNADAGLFANVRHILTNYTEGADSHV